MNKIPSALFHKKPPKDLKPIEIIFHEPKIYTEEDEKRIAIKQKEHDKFMAKHEKIREHIKLQQFDAIRKILDEEKEKEKGEDEEEEGEDDDEWLDKQHKKNEAIMLKKANDILQGKEKDEEEEEEKQTVILLDIDKTFNRKDFLKTLQKKKVVPIKKKEEEQYKQEDRQKDRREEREEEQYRQEDRQEDRQEEYMEDREEEKKKDKDEKEGEEEDKKDIVRTTKLKDMEGVSDEIIIKKVRKPREKKFLQALDEKDISENMKKRIKKIPKFEMNVPSYYLNNRKVFIRFINKLFEPYKRELELETSQITCDDIGKESTKEFSLLFHQKIIRDYMNLYTPYRGLLLYHGLGSGKTCTSIAIAEGLKNSKQVIIMTPASLQKNYIEQLKECGDYLYKKNQYWEWVPYTGDITQLKELSTILNLESSFITRQKGAWLIDVTKEPNYKSLSLVDKEKLNNQIEKMILKKYKFINYNGIRKDNIRNMTNNFTRNLFDNTVVIIDEGHNLISRIVNKINNLPKKSTHHFIDYEKSPLSLILYELLLTAKNARVVILTGTPIINYPNEFGILFNILRGYIKTWNFQLRITDKADTSSFRRMFQKEKYIDYLDYNSSSKILSVQKHLLIFMM